MKTTKNFNPGHFIQFKGSGFTLDNIKDRAELFNGVLLEMPWATIEPSEGVFDFTLVESYLGWCAANSKQLILMFLDRDFKKGSSIIPKWMINRDLTTKFNGVGTIAKIWTKEVTALRSSVLSAICEKYKGNSFLESIVLQETALGGITPSNMPGFTYSGYTAQICALIESLKDASNNVQVWQSINWLGGFDTPYLKMIAETIRETGIGGLTNPDSVPWAVDEKPMYSLMYQFSTDVSIAFGGDTSQLGKPGKQYPDFDELVKSQYAMSFNHGAHYQIWNSSFNSKEVSSTYYSDLYREAINKMLSNTDNKMKEEIPLTLLSKKEETEIQLWFKELESLLERGKLLI